MAEYDGAGNLLKWNLGNFGFKTPNSSYYFLKDHIGNIRVTVNQNGTVVTKDDYYPFGLQMPGLCYNAGNDNDRLKFSGKELDEEGGLYKYHFGWRDYDPELGRWYVVDPMRQGISPYVGIGNNPIIFYDEDGRWFGIDDLFIAGVSFITGYVSHGLSTGDWGWDAIASGGIAAGSAWLAYNFGPAGLDYGRYLANSVLRVASSQIPPLRIGNMSISPGFMIGSDGLRVGIDMGIGMRIGDMNVSVGAGLYNNSSGFVSGLQGTELRRSIMFSYGNWSFGLNDFQSGETSQNTWMLGWNDGTWSFAMENDMFLGSDKYRTAAAQIGYNNGHGTSYTFGLTLYTGDPGEPGKRKRIPHPDSPAGMYSNVKNENWKLGALYGGIKVQGQNIQMGGNSEYISHIFQNVFVHKNFLGFFGNPSPYFPYNLNSNTKFYFNHSRYNPYTFY